MSEDYLLEYLHDTQYILTTYVNMIKFKYFYSIKYINILFYKYFVIHFYSSATILIEVNALLYIYTYFQLYNYIQ